MKYIKTVYEHKLALGEKFGERFHFYKMNLEDQVQLPDLFKVSIDKRITVIVRNIETHFDEFELKGILYDLASENGEVKDIKIPKSKKFFDYQLKKEVLQPRIAFITYPHEADAHYSIEYLNGQRLGNSIITAELCEEKKTW